MPLRSSSPIAVAVLSAALLTSRSPGPPSPGRIVRTASMGTPRSGHTASLLPSGLVLITGGMKRNGEIFATAELYDPRTDTFRPTAGRMTSPRVGHAAAVLPDGLVLIGGGWDERGTLATAELYDPRTETFRLTGRMRVARGDFTATLVRTGRVLVAGGEDRGALREAELYDPTTGTFAAAGSMNVARTMHTATVLPDGRVLIAGGGEYKTPSAGAEVFDPSTGAFALTGSLHDARYKHGAVLLSDSTVLVLGGSDGRDWNGMWSSAELYDPRQGTFTLGAAMRHPRFKFPGSITLLPTGNALVAGGAEQPELYDPRRRVFITTQGTLDGPRYYATATNLDHGRVLIAGGYDRTGVATAQAWLYRP